VVAVFLGWMIRGERLDRYMFVGMIVIVAAVVLVTTSKLVSSNARHQEEAVSCEAGAD
jgi:drug/metabolite transporter (DMT)-like permease